ncbi:MAG: prepilin-type N-terminal cleavage/methylation domain-containing protein [Microgenomates group bacterium]
MYKIKTGFTLIELLVVIAIIAIITSIGVANLITAQKQARDSARREIISNVQSAFEQYFAEYGVYPVAPNEGAAFESGTGPKDPKDPTTTITWGTSSSSTYCICATLEMGSGNALAPSGSTCNWSDTGTYYCAQNKQ